MTLCLAWKRGHSISFASDSRLTGGYSVNSDMATKIYKLQVRVEDRKTNAIVHDLSWGMCFCGSYLNGSVVAGAINEILSTLQIESEIPIDAEAISTIAFEVFKEISDHMIGLHRQAGFSRILVGGLCPASGQVHIFHFNWGYRPGGEGIEYSKTEELFENSLVAIGDSNAVKLTKALSSKISYDKFPLYTEYHLLQEVIDDQDIPGVGGAIQTGHFLQGRFRLFGMVDYEIVPLPTNGDLVWVKPIYKYAGIPINKALESEGRFRIDTAKIFMAPFTDKAERLQQEANEANGVK